MSQNLPNMIQETISKVREMMDVNSVVGEPITTADGVTIIPVSKVSLGVAVSGFDFSRSGGLCHIQQLVIVGAHYEKNGRGDHPSAKSFADETHAFTPPRREAGATVAEAGTPVSCSSAA